MSDRRGFTLLEMMIALVIGFVVLLALGRIIQTNQRSWEWGRDKVELQANTTEALETLTRQVHASFRLEVPPDTSSLRTFSYDAAGDTVQHYYYVGPNGRLQVDDGVANGVDVVARQCARFHVVPDDSMTSVTLTLVLVNRVGDRVSQLTRATPRNQNLHF